MQQKEAYFQWGGEISGLVLRPAEALMLALVPKSTKASPGSSTSCRVTLLLVPSGIVSVRV